MNGPGPRDTRAPGAAPPPPRSGGLADIVWEETGAPRQRVAVSVRGAGGVRHLTVRALRQEVLALAKGFLGSGIGPGDRVGVMCVTRYEWTLVDFALWSIGAASVPVPYGSPVAEAEWILGGSRARACVVEDVDQAMTVAPLLSRLPGLHRLWQLDAGGLDLLYRAGAGCDDSAVHRHRRAVGPGTVASVVHTAGTTGPPKACLITHGNLRAAADRLLHVYGDVLESREGVGVLLHAPFEDVTTRVVQLAALLTGGGIAHQPPCSPTELRATLKELRPDVLVTEPRTTEGLVAAFRESAEREGRAGAFGAALDIAVRHAEARERGGLGSGARVRVQHDVLDRRIYSDLRESLGGNLRHVLLCGTGMRRRPGLFWAGIGVRAHESYGLTELTGAVTLGPPGRLRQGTAGLPLPGTTLHVDETGHLWVRGEHTSTSYAADGAPLPRHDWVATGDLGRLDPDGRLTVLGRVDDLLVTADGTQVMPLPLEEEVRAHPLVVHCVVVGHGRPYVGALITLDPRAVAHWLRMCGRRPLTPRELTHDPELLAEIHRVVLTANRKAPAGAAIRTFRVLPGRFTAEQGLLTRASQPRRRRVEQVHAAEVEALYRV
ncbi:AMP-dependent synthetase/ligase [Streptomyces sp. NPDC007818]|uniref:AMP-dependent synthetase/ligase n=1 Tax=Streptomyces sp. NPDC007818 TaxID=3364780 RepID=UPI0036CFB0C1